MRGMESVKFWKGMYKNVFIFLFFNIYLLLRSRVKIILWFVVF